MKKVLLALCVALIPFLSHSSPLEDAFRTVGSAEISGSKAFQTQVRTGVFLGSGRVRFGSPGTGQFGNLISFTPPRLDVGCNGIDFHLGGFSSVNGEQILKVLEAAVPAAAMYALEMVVGGLCGDCLNSLRNVLAKVNEYSSMLNNSCALGQMMARTLGAPDSPQSCRSLTATEGAATDQFSARQSVCEGAKKVSDALSAAATRMDSILAGMTSASEEEKREAAQKLDIIKPQLMNDTWWTLSVAGLVPREFTCENDGGACGSTNESDEKKMARVATAEIFLSILGGSTPNGTDGQTVVLAPSMSNDTFVDILMCGAHGAEGGPGQQFAEDFIPRNAQEIEAVAHANARSYCSKKQTQSSSNGGQNQTVGKIQMIVCNDVPPTESGGRNDSFRAFRECKQLTRMDYDDWYQARGHLAIGEGFMFYTNTMVFEILSHMATNTAFDEDHIAFMSAMPFPMYKAVNLAATFPELQFQLLGKRTELIATLLASEYVRVVIQNAARSAVPVPAAPAILNAINEITFDANRNVDTLIAALDSDLNRAERLTMSINSIETSMRRSVLARGIASNYDYSRRSADVLRQGDGAFN